MRTTKLLALAAGLAFALPFAATAEDAPGVFKIPGTDSTIKFYGYVQLDTTFDIGSRDPNVEGDDWATVAALNPLNGSFDEKNKKGQLYLTARTSRFGIQTNTPVLGGAVGLKLEADFNGPNLEQGQTFTNSMVFRLRHAYGTVGGGWGTLLVGQTWTTFLDFGGAPDTVDFNGPGSLALVRNPMIRYTSPSMSGWTVVLAAENAPGTDGNDYNPSSVTTRAYQQIPDFHANVSTGGSWGSFSIRGVLIDYKRASATVGADSYSKVGYGAAASGSVKVGADTLVAQLVGGGGVGRYLLNMIGNPFVADSGTDLFMTDAIAYHAGYTHVWGPTLRSNLIGSQTFIKENPAATGGNKRIDQAFVNSFWGFSKNCELGLEYVYGQRKQFDGQLGIQHRVNATFHYNFF